jgi:hypothetical protein
MGGERGEREDLTRGGVEQARGGDMGGNGPLVMQQVDAARELGAGEVLGQSAVRHPGANRVAVPGGR